jgi:Cdc6-like AAA superfamily ATPase
VSSAGGGAGAGSGLSEDKSEVSDDMLPRVSSTASSVQGDEERDIEWCSTAGSDADDPGRS